MRGEAEIFLGDLEFHHQRRPGHGAEQRMEGLARLEVDRAVLDLDEDIVAEPAVERLEFRICLLVPVLGILGGIDEGPPHQDAAMRGERIRQHVRPFGMGAMIIGRARLALRIGLDQQAAEIGDDGVDLVDLGLPPGAHRGVERIGRREPAQLDRRGEARGEIDLDAIGPEGVGQRLHLLQIVGAQDIGIGVDVGQHRAVDADRGIGPGIVGVARVLEARQLLPVPDRLAGIAALDMAIEIVPMVEDADLELGRVGDVELVDRLAGLEQLQETEHAVERADIAVACDDGHALALHRGAAEEIALPAQLRERQVEPLHQRRAGADDQHRAVPKLGTLLRQVPAEHPPIAPLELVDGSADRRAVAGRDDAADLRFIPRLRDGFERPIAQPEIISVFGIALIRKAETQKRRQNSQQFPKHRSSYQCAVIRRR